MPLRGGDRLLDVDCDGSTKDVLVLPIGVPKAVHRASQQAVPLGMVREDADEAEQPSGITSHEHRLVEGSMSLGPSCSDRACCAWRWTLCRPVSIPGLCHAVHPRGVGLLERFPEGEAFEILAQPIDIAQFRPGDAGPARYIAALPERAPGAPGPRLIDGPWARTDR